MQKLRLGLWSGLFGAIALVAICLAVLGTETDLPVFFLFIVLTACIAAFLAGRIYAAIDHEKFDQDRPEGTVEERSSKVELIGKYLDKSLAPCLVLDTDRRVLESNGPIENLWGISKGRLKGCQIAFSDEAVAESIWDMGADEVLTGRSEHRAGSLFLRGEIKSEGVFHFTWINYPEAGIPAILVEVAEPVSAARILENQRIEMIEALRLRDDDRSLLKELNHGLRTELQGLLGMIELLRGRPSPIQQQKYLNSLQASTQQVISSVDTLIDFFEIDEPLQRREVEGYSLDELLSGISSKLNQRSDTDTFEVLYDTDSSVSRVIRFPREILEKLICHLVSHMVRLGRDSWVVVRLRVVTEENEKPTLDIEVVERIKPGAKHLHSVLNADAISLDLEIARRLAAAVHGQLLAGQFSGDGIGFKFSTDDIFINELASGFVVPNYLKNLRVLIIDDNPVSREILQQLAYEIGWQADVAASGESALHMMSFKSGLNTSYDIVLVDWRMPDIDGWETSKRIRNDTVGGALPIIVMISAHNQEFLSKGAEERGEIINGFLPKPVSLSMLMDAVIDATAHKYEPEPRDLVDMDPRDELNALTGRKILVVDDNAMNQEVARELLALYGATVITASGGYAAITTVQTSADALDAVLMDIQMPDLDGLTAAKHIRELGYASLPIIMMTANASDAVRSECFKIGTQDLVQKPFMAHEVVNTLVLNLEHKETQTEVIPTEHLSPGTLVMAKELGMDIEAALKSFEGSLTSYARTLTNFRIEAVRMLPCLEEQFIKQNPEDVARKLRTVGGMLGLIGLAPRGVEAKELASDIAQLKREYDGRKHLYQDCEKFERELRASVGAAERLERYLKAELDDRKEEASQV